MSKQNLYVDMLNEVYRSYDHFNKHFYKSSLPRPVITITRTGKNVAVGGWFCGNSWKNISGDKIHEIRLCPNMVNFLGIDGFLMILLHEMAHLVNQVNGIEDCTTTQYHNKAFKVAAEKLGLEVTKHKTRGYATTTLGQEAKDVIATLKPNKKLYTLYLNNEPDENDKDKKDKKKQPRMPVTTETLDLIRESVDLDPNASTQTEFVTNAVNFYTAYLKGEFTIVNKKNLDPKKVTISHEELTNEMLKGVKEAMKGGKK